MKAYEKALALIEEFTDCILYDQARRSIVVNVDLDHLIILEKELKKLDYSIIFTNHSNHTNKVTCTFSYDHSTSDC